MKQDNLLLLAGAGAAAYFLLRNKSVSGVGATGWDYAKYELDRKGIDLRQNYFAINSGDLHEVWQIAKKSGYRQSASSKATGRSYGQAFWYAMQNRYL